MKIVNYPHPALRHKSVPLTAIDQQVRAQAEQMLELMYDARGLGLASNQVALPYQMIVMNLTGDANQRDQEGVFINPVVLNQKGSMEDEEGCLSFPGLFGKVRRPRTVTVQAYTLEGESVEITCSDLQARVWQHEIDHLHGILFIDKMGTIGRLTSRGKLKEFEREFREAQERGEIPADAEIEKTLAHLAQEVSG